MKRLLLLVVLVVSVLGLLWYQSEDEAINAESEDYDDLLDATGTNIGNA